MRDSITAVAAAGRVAHRRGRSGETEDVMTHPQYPGQPGQQQPYPGQQPQPGAQQSYPGHPSQPFPGQQLHQLILNQLLTM